MVRAPSWRPTHASSESWQPSAAARVSRSRTVPTRYDSLHRMPLSSTRETSTLPPPRSTRIHLPRERSTRVRAGQVNEPGLFPAADGLEVDVRFGTDALKEPVAVLRLAGRAGRHRPKALHTQPVDFAAEAPECGHGSVHGGVVEAARSEDPVPQPDRLADPVDHVVRRRRLKVGRDEADRVRSGIDGGDSGHGITNTRSEGPRPDGSCGGHGWPTR